MNGTLRDGLVHVGEDARQRFYDARGYGRPAAEDGIVLAPVEAAHLLYRGDLSTVDGRGFRRFVAARDPSFLPLFLVYADLRGRGFYLSPARSEWVAEPGGVDLVVYPRGQGPWDDEVAHRVRVLDERTPVAVEELGNAVLAVVDEESEITYLETTTGRPTGAGTPDPPTATAQLVGHRVLVWDPPAELHGASFYGQPLGGDGGAEALHLSLIEAASLAAKGVLSVDVEESLAAIIDRGRTVEGDRFDRRLQVYRDLRQDGLVPKTGFKFGADFRVYPEFESADEVGHSTSLIRVLAPDSTLLPRDIALDVRLAHGVRKTMRFALPDRTEGTVGWRTVGRLRP
ncbi:MAG: tRNA-intron lyase [Halobacteriaceae archaeon]